MTLQFGEIVLIRVPFHQTAGAKIRPAVVVADTGDEDFIRATLTSQARNTPCDLFVKDWRSAELNVASWVRANKVMVLAKGDIVRRLGSLGGDDNEHLARLTCRIYCREQFPR
jgi:mRNA interferase MazF